MADLTTDQQSAYDQLKALFQSYGLPTDSDILDVLKTSAINGDSPDMTTIRLQDTQSWKTRFAGNEQRKAAGLDVLSVPEYLAQEKQYGDILHAAGLPTGFYDDPADFADFIGKSVSASELQDRVSIASDIAQREDPAVLAQLAARGLNQGSLIAYALDPDRAAPLVKRDMNSVLIGAAAARAGINTNLTQDNSLAERGIGEAQAQQGFGQVADLAKTTGKLGGVYGVDYSTDDAIGDVFDTNVDAAAKRKRIANAEKSNFGGSANYGTTKTTSSGQF